VGREASFFALCDGTARYRSDLPKITSVRLTATPAEHRREGAYGAKRVVRRDWRDARHARDRAAVLERHAHQGSEFRGFSSSG